MLSGKTWGRFLIRSLPMVIIDVIATIAAFTISAIGSQVQEMVMVQPSLVLQVLALAAINVAFFGLCGLYSSIWKYASIYEVSKIVFVTLIATVAGDVLCALFFGWRMPFRVYVCEWFILLVAVGASRMVVRLNSSWRGWSLGSIKSISLPKALIVGAGDSGSLAIKRMNEGENPIPLCPVAFVDDNPKKQNLLIHGVKVVGTTHDIVDVCKKFEVEQIVLATPSATPEQKKSILDICAQTGLKVLTVPAAIKDAAEAEQKTVMLKEVEISDLLAREEIDLDLGQMDYVRGKCVLVTGGGGSIGSELVRQLIPAQPAKIIIFDVYENAYRIFSSTKSRQYIMAKIGCLPGVLAENFFWARAQREEFRLLSNFAI